METFNYLYGLHVEKLMSCTNSKDKRTYRVVRAKNRQSRSVLVVWRDMERLDPKVEREFLERKVKETGSFDELLINGDCAVPGFTSLDPLFKRLMEEEEK